MVDFSDYKKVELIRDQSQIALALGERSPGAHRVKLDIKGNSVLSVVYVESLDPGASLDVSYYDFTTGNEVGEKNFLKAHPTISTAQTSNRVLVGNTIDKPYFEAVVSGGNVKFSVYTTVVGTSASDISDALFLDGASGNLSVDKGLGGALYDPSDGNWYLAVGSQGVQTVNTEIQLIGEVVNVYDSISSLVSGSEIKIVDYTVPVGKKLFLKLVEGSGENIAIYKVYIDSTLKALKRTYWGVGVDTEFNFTDNLSGGLEISAGQKIELKVVHSRSESADFNGRILGALNDV